MSCNFAAGLSIATVILTSVATASTNTGTSFGFTNNGVKAYLGINRDQIIPEKQAYFEEQNDLAISTKLTFPNSETKEDVTSSSTETSLNLGAKENIPEKAISTYLKAKASLLLLQNLTTAGVRAKTDFTSEKATLADLKAKSSLLLTKNLTSTNVRAKRDMTLSGKSIPLHSEAKENILTSAKEDFEQVDVNKGLLSSKPTQNSLETPTALVDSISGMPMDATEVLLTLYDAVFVSFYTDDSSFGNNDLFQDTTCPSDTPYDVITKLCKKPDTSQTVRVKTN